MGIIIFVDDYMNIMTISACTKKLSDLRKVPREALAYVIDSTGAPVCVLLPFSTWAIFFAGIFYEQSEIVDLGYGSAMATYIHAIPYMFYALAALVIVPLFIFGVIPKLGAMKRAYNRVEETGQVYSKESQKWNKNENEEVNKEAKVVDFLLPILTMIIVQLTVGDMFIAIIAAILAAGIIYIPRKKMRTNQFCDLWVQGFADSVSALVIIVAALWMRQASADINLPDYVISVVEPFVKQIKWDTDHCGVLRIKTEKILPEYMMYALQAEGEYERFSRNNRASAQRIRSLVVQAPETKIQKNIIDELKALDDKINGQNAEIEKYENSIRTKFDQIFHLEEFISDGVFSKYEGYSVEDLCIDGRGRVINQQYIENHKGPYPVYSSQTTNDGIFGSIDTFDFDGEYITWTTDGAKAGTVFYRNGKFNCTNVCGTLKAKNDKVNMRYLAYLLNRIAYKFVSRVGNNKLMNDAMKKIVVPVPKRQLQDEFADFVQSVEKSKFECIGKKEKFEIEKDTFVHKYFR